MLITPFITVFHTSGLSETFSSLMVILSIIFIQNANENDFNILHYSFWLTFIFIIGAVITKRENLLLLTLLVLIPYFRKIQKKKIIPVGYILLSFIVIFSIFLFSYLINIPSIESNEGIAIGRQTFSFIFLIKNLIQLFIALLNFKYWGLTGILFIASIILFILKKTYNRVGVLFFYISLFYMILYSSHYRSFYQVHYDINHPFETLRYSVNYFPLICIFISSIDLRKLFFINKLYVKPIFIISVFLIIFLIFNSIQTRIGFSRDEYYSRIEQVEKTLEVAKENDIIISDVPIVFHSFVSNNQRIIDYYSLTEEALKNLISQNRDYDIYLIKAKQNTIDSIRYKMNIQLNHFCYYKINTEIEHSELIKFCNNASKN
jgi:hypothetical protein